MRPDNLADRMAARLICAYKRGGEKEAQRVLYILTRNYPMTVTTYVVMLGRFREQVSQIPVATVKNPLYVANTGTAIPLAGGTGNRNGAV